MIFDLHIHSKINSRFPFNIKHFYKMIEQAKLENIEAIVMLEHIYAVNFEDFFNYLKEHFEYNGEYYLVDGIKVFTGIEVSANLKPKPKLDFIFIGHRDEIMGLKEKLTPHIVEKRIVLENIFKDTPFENMIVIFAHPLRYHKFPTLPNNILEKVDAIECNARDIYEKPNNLININKLANKLNKPIIAGGDSHYYTQIGSVKTNIAGNPISVKELKEQIKTDNLTIEISRELTKKVAFSKDKKKLIINNNIIDFC